MLSWLTWWALLLVIGLTTAPLVALLLPGFTARGYAFAKPLGLLLLGYLYWIGVTAGALPNSRLGVVVALAVLAAASAAAVWAQRGRLDDLRPNLGFVLGVEVLFLAAFALAAFLRSYTPEIADTEKPMEIAFLNAVLRADRFPADDPWFAGEPISYYYFGFVMVAAVTKLAGTAVAAAFNLGLALTAALSVVAVFGLGYELVARSAGSGPRLPRPEPRLWAFGIGAVGLALILGNLEGVIELGAAHGWGPDGLYEWFDIGGLDLPKATGAWYPDEHWWWWRATRVVPGTITEFPFFSFLLGDLHPHVMAIPFRFLLLAIAAKTLMAYDEPPAGSDWLRRDRLPSLVIVTLALGSTGFLFAWDLPTMTALLFGAALLANLRASVQPLRALGRAAGFVGTPLVLGVIAFLPFWLSIESPGVEPAVVLGAPTRPDQALLLWGPLGSMALTFVGVALARGHRHTLRNRGVLAGALALPAVVVAVWAAWVTAKFGAGDLATELGDRGVGWLTDAALALALAATAVALAQRTLPGRDHESSDRERPATVALLLTFAGVLLVFGVEFFFIDDTLDSRLNSVFKLYFQAWLLLAAAAAYGAWYVTHGLASAPRASALFLGGILSLVLVGGLVYPVAATFARTDGFAGPRTLDGFAWLRDRQPAEYRALMWLREHSEPDDIVLEAQGDAYAEAGRVSSRTGTTTLLGWLNHEITWRGDKAVYAERAAVIDRIYNSDDPEEVVRLLRDNDVRWVYVGDLEARTYAGADLTKFGRFMDVAYDDDVRIYRMSGAGRSGGVPGLRR